MTKSTTIYGIKNCDTMKKARAWLDKHGVEYGFHDYKTSGIDRERLELRVVDVADGDWQAAGVLVDFSTPAALESHLAAAVAARTTASGSGEGESRAMFSAMVPSNSVTCWGR